MAGTAIEEKGQLPEKAGARGGFGAANANAPAAPEKKAILVVSFGTSYNESRTATIGAVEQAVAEAFPDYGVRRAFTSQIIIDILRNRDGEAIDNVGEAMNRLIADGIGTLVVQPTHVINGVEYDEMMRAVGAYEDQFASVSYGRPLLSSDQDYTELVGTLLEETADLNEDKTAVVFMGHGTEHEANSAYVKISRRFQDAGHTNYYVGTVEAAPSLEDVIREVGRGSYERVALIPLMIVAGDHANNDMAGDGEASWRTAFQAEGYQVDCRLRGMGEYKGVQSMFVRHVRDAVGERAESSG